MIKIISLMLVLVLLTGCTITGRIVEEVEQQPTQVEKEQDDVARAVEEKDVKICYYIQDQPTREECFASVAKELGDKSICNNLLGSLRTSCKEQIQS